VTAPALFSGATPRYFTIAPGRAFLRELAAALRDSAGGDPVALSDALVYLPTRRAVRGLLDAFVDTAPNGRASLLPRIRALGDAEEDALDVFDGAPVYSDEGVSEGSDSERGEGRAALAPVISSSERRLALARMVAEKDKAFFDGQRDWAGAVAAADELGKLLDSLYTEEIDFTRFETLAPDALADHWRRNLDFLSIVTRTWPAYLAARGRMDPAERRIALIERQAAAWRRAPPQTPVIIAGTTGSTPAVARMMKTVAALPRGAVILPGLDQGAPDHVWTAVDEPHPQSGLKELLSTLSISRSDVAFLAPPQDARAAARTGLLTMALRPADASDDWRGWAEDARAHPETLARALEGVELVEAPDEELEAAAIALKLRETAQSGGGTAMLVTPDRDLARRVSAKMRRWGISVDDSGGVPFSNSPCGTFLRLTAAWLADIADPVALMAMLDHPLFGGAMAPGARRKATLAFDRALRGLRPRPGVDGLRRKLAEDPAFAEEGEELFAQIAAAAGRWPKADAAFASRLDAHLEISERLAETAGDAPGRLWRGPDGETGAALLAQLRDGLDHIAHDRARDYPAIFARLIAGASVRRRDRGHPRLSILGPLEARLQTADTVILGGLNEGVWPRDAAIDPFLSRPMRRDLGLPSPERRIGLAAHDFMQLAAAPRLMLTRAARAGGKPAKPSRWIVRLKNILKGADALSGVERGPWCEGLARRLDAPAKVAPAPAPRPRPPVEARPAAFFVTRIEKLMRDPYAIYARAVLRLKKLDILDDPFGARQAGELFHRALQDYAQAAPPQTHKERVAALARLVDAHAEDYGLTADHRAFWSSRIEAALDWLAAWDAERSARGAPAVIEGEGAWDFTLDGRDFRLSARADRIDRLHDGTAQIIDYKTGAPPSLKQQATFSPQLPLTAIIAARGGFAALGPVTVAGFDYVRVIGRGNAAADTVGAQGAKAEALAREAHEGLIALLRHFNDPSTPYLSQPRPQFMDAYGDYDHLARRRERNAQGETAEGAGP